MSKLLPLVKNILSKSKLHIIVAFAFFYCSVSFGQNVGIVVYFESNKSKLELSDKQKIDSLLKGKTVGEIYLKVYCDSLENNSNTEDLSMKRFLEIRDYLVSKNIDKDKIGGETYSDYKPSDKGKKESNRRVEVVFYFLGTEDKDN